MTTLRLRAGAADALRIARFLRGRAEFSARPDDLFISSYPRSGTTWLQHIAHVLATDGDVDFAHISQVVPWFERDLSLGRKRAQDFERFPSPRIFKSHLPRMWLPHGARCLYVERDGRDVAASYYHFYQTHLGFEGDFDAFFERFLRGELQYGSWHKHVAGWRRLRHESSVRLLRYEALLDDLVGQMRSIADFCGFGTGSLRIAELAELCDFEFMKRHEDRFDHASGEPRGSAVPKGAFIRRGGRGAYAPLFSAQQLSRFEAVEQRPVRLSGLELGLAAFLH